MAQAQSEASVDSSEDSKIYVETDKKSDPKLMSQKSISQDSLQMVFSSSSLNKETNQPAAVAPIKSKFGSK